MYEISPLFEEYLERRTRQWLVKVVIDDFEYTNDKIVQFTIEKNLSATDEFTLGTAVISKLTLQLKTTDEIAPNALVVPYVALQLPADQDGANAAWQDVDVAWGDADFPWQGAVTEWVPLGEFYVDRRSQNKDVWTFECLDKLVFAAVPYVSALTYPATMQAVWDEICDSLGYEYDASVVIDPSYTISTGPAGFTDLEVMGYIASANAACVYVAKDGTIRFRRFSASDETVVEIPNSEYIRFEQTNPVKTYTRIVAVYDTEEQLAYEAGSGDENATLYIENPFITQAMVNALYVRLNGFSYYPIKMDTRGSLPQLELGDRFRYGAPVEELTWATADVAWQDADFTWDGYEAGGGISLALNQTYTFKGGLRLSIDAPSISEQESEFGIDGSLSGQINKLNQNSVKLGKSYFGATLTRTEGLKIQREDGASDVVLNSDEFTFRVGGVNKVYFDPVDGVFKFNGTLEAVDGVFSGELSAATGTFAGELVAATGTFAGSLSAASGTFAGELQAATGTFSGSLSAATGTFTGELVAATGTFGGVYSGEVTTDQLVAGSALIGSALIDTIDANQINVGVLTGFTIQNQFAAGNRVYIDPFGLHANDLAGIERITIGTTPAQGAKAIITRDSSGAAQGVYTYDTETADGATRTGQFITAHSAYLLLSNDGDLRLQNSAGQGIRAVSGTPEINDGFGWDTIATLTDIAGLQVQINAKATLSASTSSVTVDDDHNHGIPAGSYIQLYDSGGNPTTLALWVPYAGSPSHSHIQT